MKIFFILLLTTLSCFAADSDRPMHLLFVTGVAEKTIEPNMVTVRLESWAKAPTAVKAQEQQATQFVKVKAGLEKFKIRKEDIQTEAYSVNPEYNYDQKTRQNKITGYRVSHVVAIIYRKVEDSGNFLDQMVTSESDTSGVSVQNVSWDSDKKPDMEIAALADAIKNARTKAAQMATAAGVEIVAVHRMEHVAVSPPVARPMMFEAASMKMQGAAQAPTEISSGQIKVRVEVQMEFEI